MIVAFLSLSLSHSLSLSLSCVREREGERQKEKQCMTQIFLGQGMPCVSDLGIPDVIPASPYHGTLEFRASI